MKSNTNLRSEMGNPLASVAAENQRRRDCSESNAPLKKCRQSAHETAWLKFLSAVSSGNTQDQVQFLVSRFELCNNRRRQTQGHTISRSRFFATTRQLLESQGYALDKAVERACRSNLRRNSPATVSASV